MKMKKIILIILSVIFTCSIFTGCNNDGTSISNDQYNIVCTIYPQYDWVMQLLGDNADKYNVTLLLNNGADLHNYQPSAKDIIAISTCDLFIYVGGESDSWVQDVIKESTNEDMITINMLEVLGDEAYEEEIIEGMEEEEHSHDDDNLHNDDAHDEDSDDSHVEYDEHVWLSLKNARTICSEISSALCKLDDKNKTDYDNALNAYTQSIDALDKKYADTVLSAKRNTLLFGDRFPFRYFVEDYNLDYYAAFPGCSAETEASFQTIVFLAEKTDELNLPAVCVTESSDQSIASTIIDNTKSQNQQILILDSMQSVTENDIQKGISYLTIMESNLEVLRTALN